MRISDWSSDVCSSDRVGRGKAGRPRPVAYHRDGERVMQCSSQRNCALRLDADDRYDSGEGRSIARSRRAHQEFHARRPGRRLRSEEHTSELQSLMRISYAVFCLKKKKQNKNKTEKIHIKSRIK